MAGDQGAGGGLSEAPVAIVAAVARNGVIGAHNGLVWKLSSDLQRFRLLTLGKPVIMGRKTWDSIGRPLPGRAIIVVTSAPDFAAPGVASASSLEAALAAARTRAAAMGAGEIIIAGGGEIYQQSIGLAERLYITEVDLTPQGEVFFPRIDSSQWRETARIKMTRGERDEADCDFVDYARRADTWFADLPLSLAALPFTLVMRRVNGGSFDFGGAMTGRVIAAGLFGSALAYVAGLIVEALIRLVVRLVLNSRAAHPR